MNISQVGSTLGWSTGLDKLNSQPRASDTHFAASLTEAAAQTARVLQSADATAVSAITGTAAINDVVSKILEAERALHFTLAVRDKAVSAFQEISRMQI